MHLATTAMLIGKMTRRDVVSSSVQDIKAAGNTRKTVARARNHLSHTLFTDQEEHVTIDTNDAQNNIADINTSQ